MTLQEAKNNYAKDLGYQNFDDYYESNNSISSDIESDMEKIAGYYAEFCTQEARKMVIEEIKQLVFNVSEEWGGNTKDMFNQGWVMACDEILLKLKDKK